MLDHTTPHPPLFQPSLAPTAGQAGDVTEPTRTVPSPDTGRAAAPAPTGPEPAPIVRELLRVEEAARRLSIGRTHMFALIRDKVVESVKVGRSRRVPADAIIAYITGLRTGHHQPATG